ncbi:hypothetical protein L596_030469 [Steinernema carpocapsae]|nr:hypothetical protein L596_030469 [Steinernema carpocapsae]
MSKKPVHIRDDQICAESGGKGVGAGDSGGPIKVKVAGKWTQIGLTSFGVGVYPLTIKQHLIPAVFTRVSKFCSFLEISTYNEFNKESF